MAKTYEPIATTTATTGTGSFTFSSIPSTYTDLRLILNWTGSGSLILLRFNSDTTTVYSNITLGGNTTAVGQSQDIGDNCIQVQCKYTVSGNALTIFDIMSYSATGQYKNVLQTTAANNAGGTGRNIEHGAGIWANNAQAAINTITITGTTFTSGDTATLFGIKKA